MGVILELPWRSRRRPCAPHTHGGDSQQFVRSSQLMCTPHTHGGDSPLPTTGTKARWVLPIHMGVILANSEDQAKTSGTPHTHGGDSYALKFYQKHLEYSPYTWG